MTLPPRQPRVPDGAFGTEQKGECDRCEGEGRCSQMAPCTTFGPDCGCHETIEDVCPDCGGDGYA